MNGSGTLNIQLRDQLGAFRLDVNTQLPSDGITAVFGPSGCGKSTLLRCLSGLHQAEGHLHFRGQCWQNNSFFLAPHKRPVAMVFQDNQLFPHRTVEDNIDYGFKRSRASEHAITPEQCIQWFGIKPLLKRYPGQLSGGEKQRVALARAMACNPELLVMDEALSALDQQSKRAILDVVLNLPSSLGMPIIYVSHVIEEVARIADYLAIMKSGQIVAHGPLQEVLADPDLELAQRDDAGVVIEARVLPCDSAHHLQKARFDGGELWFADLGAQVGDTLRLRLLARDISVSLTEHVDQSILNILPARVEAIRPGSHPATCMLRLNVGNSSVLSRLTKASVERLGIHEGQNLWVQIKSVAVIE